MIRAGDHHVIVVGGMESMSNAPYVLKKAFFFQAEDGIRVRNVTGVQTCALPILLSTRLACLTHPIGAAIVMLVGGAAASAFAIFNGAGNGLLTIARGTLPLAIFGPQNYGYRLGIIGAPARMAQAAAPLAFGLLIDTMGSRILIVSSALSLSALLALLLLPKRPVAP